MYECIEDSHRGVEDAKGFEEAEGVQRVITLTEGCDASTVSDDIIESASWGSHKFSCGSPYILHQCLQ